MKQSHCKVLSLISAMKAFFDMHRLTFSSLILQDDKPMPLRSPHVALSLTLAESPSGARNPPSPLERNIGFWTQA